MKSLVEALPSHDIGELGQNLLAAVDRRRGPNAAADDQTLIVIKRSAGLLPRARSAAPSACWQKMIGLRPV